MLDRKFILENLEAVKTNCANRGVQVDVDALVGIEQERKAKLKEAEEYNRQANEMSKLIGKAASDTERNELKDQGRKLRELKDAAQGAHDRLEVEMQAILTRIPNMAHPSAPIGRDDQANLEVARGKTAIPHFDYAPKDHLELGRALDMIDFEGGARVAGAGFYFLKNEAVLLELALQQFAVQQLVQRGFTPITTPDVAQTSILHGIGFNPRGPETQIYSIENTDLNLIATAEITLGGMMSGEVLEAEKLPLKMVGISHCFRTEAGASRSRVERALSRSSIHQD